MSEKRRPAMKLIAQIQGKTRRRFVVELFPADLWPTKFGLRSSKRYRVRVNGKWYLGSKAFSLSQVIEIYRATIVARR